MTNKDLTKYSNKPIIRHALGAAIKDPTLLRKYNITSEDFPETFHQLIFGAIHNLSANGTEKIGPLEIDEYLSHYDAQHILFTKYKGVEYVQSLMEIAVPDNIQYYYEQLKKFSLLRSYVKHGIDVSEYFDPTEVDPAKSEEKRKKFDNASIVDIVNHFRAIQLEISAPFRQQQSGDAKKAGVGGLEQKEKWKEGTAWGLGYSSAYLTEALHGLRPNTFTVKSAGTGVGKTRTAIGDLAYACSPYYYDSRKGVWARNPNGTNNGALYIGTEMKLLEEIDPILWAYIADVPQDHIVYNGYELGEEERVEQAIQILQNESNIWLAYEPDFSCATIEDIIEEHVLKYGVQYVWFDYIQTTPTLISEFQNRAKAKIALREDQVLLDFSARLKQMAEDYNLCINTATQVNGNYRDEQIRDQSIIAGAKAIANKADNALVAMPPTSKELELIAPILEKLQIQQRPNLIYSVYKVRGGVWKDIKIWLYVDYGTMRTHDLFVTTNEYELVPDIRPTYICRENELVASDTKSFFEIDKDICTVANDIDW